eukprot:CAMPEP_0114381034 /NCGR_PEP_ID=MMETSP0102-20121206/3218_1 /TAXON_ID=38822 ORGANISM="Pteridomonas danica, Strain PT" /NCGR_SAMPLE_ID=MMETSP0102 /ASSEMBLY_ACC=CAM_ASM_000212 /LENGTH=657 /DNA_ID=CAMNT_0001536457 /DNA_START=78 /DNA_END=2052 /DNA_ORIENTATION=+
MSAAAEEQQDSAPKDKDMFRSIGELAEDEEFDGMSIIPGSLCMQCGESGDTRMMTTKIPFFREIIVCSFECDSCGSCNNEVTFGGEIQEKGVRYELVVLNKLDMNRSVIKADSATVSIPSLEFEIPARSQKGGITTVEGLLSKAIENLSMYQDERMIQDPLSGAAVALIIVRLRLMCDGDAFPFRILVDDPSGNSFVENLCAPNPDPQLTVFNYHRTPNQDIAIGLQPPASVREELENTYRYNIDNSNPKHGAIPEQHFDGAREMMNKFGESLVPEISVENNPLDNRQKVASEDQAYLPDGTPNPDEAVTSSLGRREIIRMPTQCPHCNLEGESLTCFTDIPHFKEVIIMAFDCIGCGYRSNEVKGGGGVPKKGQLFSLLITSEKDFARDIMKSSTGDVIIPELDLEASQGSLGGIFTSVEGLLKKVHKTMLESTPYMMGDSAQDSNRKTEFELFTSKFEAIAEGRLFPFTLQLRDPLANSFIGTLYGQDPTMDDNLTITDYVRSYDEDDELGLHDINVSGNYGNDDEGDDAKKSNNNDDDNNQQEQDEEDLPNPNKAVTNKRWGPDHPHHFAKGCEDKDTTLATPIQDSQPGEWATSEDDDANKNKSSWHVNQVKFGDNEETEFEASIKFMGSKEGFVFKKGGKGLGYYKDALHGV